MSLEKRMGEALNRMELREWRAVWKPGCSTFKRGEVLPENRLILIYDLEEKAALETLIHEILEIKLRGITQPYRTLINSLITWAEEQAYREKEKVINGLIPLLQSRLGEAEPKPDPAPKEGLADEPPQRGSPRPRSDPKKLRETIREATS